MWTAAVQRAARSQLRTIVARLLAVCVLLPIAAWAGWISKSGEPLPDTDSRKAVGDFGVQLLLVRDEKALIKNWNTPSETVEMTPTDTVEVNGAIHAFIVFSGCARDKEGRCSVAVRFKVTKPDGSVYGETPPMEVWYLKPAPRGHFLELSADYLKIVIEPKDPVGRYRIEAQVRDNNSRVVIPLSTSFSVTDGASES